MLRQKVNLASVFALIYGLRRTLAVSIAGASEMRMSPQIATAGYPRVYKVGVETRVLC